MAYASLLSLTQTLEQILQSQPQLHDESQLFLDEEQQQLRSLHEKLSDLLLFLENSAPTKTETILYLEERIRDAAYEAEDSVESHMTRKSIGFQEVTSRYRKIINVLQRYVKCSVSTKTSQPFEKTFEESLQNVIEKLSSISEEVEKMKENNNRDVALQQLTQIIEDPLTSRLPSMLESNSAVENLEIDDEAEQAAKVHRKIFSGVSSLEPAPTDKRSMVGFKSDMLQIKDILTGSSTKLEIISIVGMGGIGKTTLATNIYNDSLVNRHFDIRAWITVSQDYDVVALLASLLRSTGDATVQINEKDETKVKMKLYQSLKQRRYLIVMDDVWDDNIFEKFRNIFPDDYNGSRIIITSRSSKAIGLDNSCNHIHHLNFLGPDQSWNLLCQQAFKAENCPPELECIGRRIAENCNGLPLSLVAIGGVLHKAQKTLAHWVYVEENLKSTETGNYDRSMEILSWSYNQLPYHLKACFLYMGVFREDFVVRISHLIMLWVANGFIKPVSSKTLEEVAMEYVKDLIDRNLIMIRERGYCRGEIKTCVMHDLMRNMCIKKAQAEKFLFPDSLLQTSPVSSKGYRHISIPHSHIILSEFENVRTIRSIQWFRYEIWEIMSFHCLKVFDGCQIIFRRFPVELVQLVNLRFIALVRKGIGKIPVSLSKLRFLQTLLIFSVSYEKKVIIIPLEILKMPQLMHLWVERSVLPDFSGGRIENLHTLHGITNLRFTEETLAIFPNLKKLQVSYLSQKLASGSCFENIAHVRQLEYLKIHNYDEDLPSIFQSRIDLGFPVSLRKLSLYRFKLSQRQVSTIGKLPNLEVLKLNYVKLLDGWKTNEGEFPELRFLFMKILGEFSWNLDGIHFPNLECLTLYHNYFRYLPSEIGEIPNLKVINLYGCPSSVIDSAHKIREDREEWGNDTLQINVHQAYHFSGLGGFRRYMLRDWYWYIT